MNSDVSASDLVVEDLSGGRLVRVAGEGDAWLWASSDDVVDTRR
jgi:hypothetical protein